MHEIWMRPSPWVLGICGFTCAITVLAHSTAVTATSTDVPINNGKINKTNPPNHFKGSVSTPPKNQEFSTKSRGISLYGYAAYSYPTSSIRAYQGARRGWVLHPVVKCPAWTRAELRSKRREYIPHDPLAPPSGDLRPRTNYSLWNCPCTLHLRTRPCPKIK